MTARKVFVALVIIATLMLLSTNLYNQPYLPQPKLQPWFFSFDNETLYTSLEKEIIESYWTKDFFERRLKEVDVGEGRDIRTGDCQNCFLNASCYRASDPFHPTLCDIPSKTHMWKTCDLANPPILIIGDSRARMLFALIAMMYESHPKVSCYNAYNSAPIARFSDSESATLPFWMKKPNREVFQSFRQVDKSGVIKLSMIWDPLMFMEEDTIVEEFHSMGDQMKSGFVVLHLGAWVQWFYNDTAALDRVSDKLDQRLGTLLDISRPVNATVIMLLDPHTDFHPVWFKNISIISLSTSSIADMARSVASKHPGVIVWDSHIHVTEVYRKICKSAQVPNSRDSLRLPWLPEPCYFGEASEWMCSDLMHPSGLVMRQYAEMLLNFMCYHHKKRFMELKATEEVSNKSEENGLPISEAITLITKT